MIFSPEISVTNTPLPVQGTVSVTATDLDTRDLSQTTDSVRVGDGSDTLAVNADGSINVQFTTGALTPTVTRVSVSPVATTLLSADSNRKRFILHNETGTLFVKLGSGASTTDYTFRMTANTTLAVEFQQNAAVTAAKASGTSDVQVTSLS